MRGLSRPAALVVALLAVVVVAGCGSAGMTTAAGGVEHMTRSRLPTAVRGDLQLLSLGCSKAGALPDCATPRLARDRVAIWQHESRASADG